MVQPLNSGCVEYSRFRWCLPDRTSGRFQTELTIKRLNVDDNAISQTTFNPLTQGHLVSQSWQAAEQKLASNLILDESTYSQAMPAFQSPAQPLLAWSVAPDGAVYVLDALLYVYELAPSTLSPVAHSIRLGSVVGGEVAAMAADNERIYLSGPVLGQTVLLRRIDLTVETTLAATLNRRPPGTPTSALMAVDPGRHLFLVSEGGVTASGYSRNALWAYDLSDLTQPPEALIPASLGEGTGFAEPQGLVIDAEARHLFVAIFSAPGTSPRNSRGIGLIHLDSFERLEGVDLKNGFSYDSLPTIASASNLLAMTSTPRSGWEVLHLYDRAALPLSNQSQEPLAALSGLGGQPKIDPQGDWLYLPQERGLWVLRSHDLSLASIFPFVNDHPTDLLISPDGKTLYLFGNGWQSALSTAELHTMGIATVQPFPENWASGPSRQNLIFTSPQVAEDGTVLRPLGGPHSTYRSLDGGVSWRPLININPEGGPSQEQRLAANSTRFSLSPDFVQDRTLTAANGAVMRSLDAGETWHFWAPRMAFASDRSGNRDIFTADEQGEGFQQITANPANDETPAWSPAWTRIAFASDRSGNWDIYTIRADCAPQFPEDEVACDLRQLTDNLADDLLPAWSPDGRAIAFVSMRDGNPEIYMMELESDTTQRITWHDGGDWRPAWLPNGTQLVFTSDRNGNNDLFIQNVRQDRTLNFFPVERYEYFTARPIVEGPADERDPAMTAAGHLLFWTDEVVAEQIVIEKSTEDQADQGQATDGAPIQGMITALPRFGSRFGSDPQERVHYSIGEGVVGHPSGLPNPTEYSRLLASIQQEGDVDIYRIERENVTPLITGPGFDGHPAGTPVWWDPNFSW